MLFPRDEIVIRLYSSLVAKAAPVAQTTRAAATSNAPQLLVFDLARLSLQPVHPMFNPIDVASLLLTFCSADWLPPRPPICASAADPTPSHSTRAPLRRPRPTPTPPLSPWTFLPPAAESRPFPTVRSRP
uniref:Uncharacterized protein n=1 Tax=Mycena chlorophos TaxID=658473 RepID=A0ABQ0L152_MYCCL|nr:predicted protein [Mycena chlorophos]